MRNVIIASTLVTLLSSTANAAVVVAFEEVGTSVVGTVSGQLDLAGVALSRTATSDFGAFLDPAEAFFVGGSGSTVLFDEYDITGPTSFGTGGGFNGSYTGDLFVVDGLFQHLRISAGYAGEALNGTLTFADTSISDFGLSANSFSFAIGNDTIDFTFTEAAPQVPVPASLPLMVFGLGALGWLRRKSL